MRNLALVLTLLIVPFLMGSDCEERRLEGLDNGLMTTDQGVPLRPMVLPWEVVAYEFEHPQAVDEAIEQMNGWFEPTQVFMGGVDIERWEELEFADPQERYGIILVSAGSLATPDWDDGLDFNDDGGIADLRWNDEGEIVLVDIIMNIDYAYDRGTTRRTLLHEFGHALGLGHDGDSIDLGSCMSSPPPHDCEIIEADVERVVGE